MSKDPIHQNSEGKWCFWDEIWSDEIGLYETEEEAEKLVRLIIKQTQNERSNQMKKCIIHNGRFSYELIVDGLEISFQSGSAADYFETHYSLLGYEVTRTGNGSKNYREV